jgi:hypothetical protein
VIAILSISSGFLTFDFRPLLSRLAPADRKLAFVYLANHILQVCEA